MNRSSFIKSTLAYMQIIVLMICIFACRPYHTTAQETTAPATTGTTAFTQGLDKKDPAYVQALQDQQTALKDQSTKLQQARQFYSDSLDDLLKRKESIQKEIALKQQEIDIHTLITQSLTDQMDATDEDLIVAEQTMLLKRQRLLSRFEELRKKLRELSKGGSMTPLHLIFSTDSYTSFLINKKIASRIAAADQEAITALEDELREIRSLREGLQQQQLRLEEARRPYDASAQDLQTAKTELLALHAEATQVEDLLANNMTYFRTQYMELATKQRALYLQLMEVTGNHDVTDLAAPTLMQWPTPDCTIITSSFKSRWGKWHYGLDIASFGDSTGKTIRAAADGTVVFAGTDNSGYGNYLIIDHGHDMFGKRIVTLYGHCHELLVKEGDLVLGGITTIATVGDTGRSSGAHLHFEVRVDGSAVDPIKNGYLVTDGIIIAD